MSDLVYISITSFLMGAAFAMCGMGFYFHATGLFLLSSAFTFTSLAVGHFAQASRPKSPKNDPAAACENDTMAL